MLCSYRMPIYDAPWKKVITIQLANETLLVFRVSFMQIFSSREHNQWVISWSYWNILVKANPVRRSRENPVEEKRCEKSQRVQQEGFHLQGFTEIVSTYTVGS